MKSKIKYILRPYSGIQLLLLTTYGSPKTIDDVESELDRRALKGEDQRRPEPSEYSQKLLVPTLS